MRTKRCFVLLMLFLTITEMGAQTLISGTVTEGKTGTPIPGVNVIVKGTLTGTTTDFDGKYEIPALQGSTLIFSYIGFRTREIVVSGPDLDVALEEDAQQLDEVVIIGYGTTSKKDATGSVTAVTSKDFAKGNIVTAENLLSGRAAGVVISTGGAPGAGSNIRIRGGASLDASNDPLIVIDGLPISNSRAGGSRSVLSGLNPNDIASFTILKDASATAIYGSRASNGVIIISTKRGGKKLQVDYNMQMGINTLGKKINVFDADEFRAIVTDREPGLIPLLGDSNTDWQDEIYRDAVQSDQNISVRGSILDFLPARLSLGHIDQEGLRLTSNFQRTTAALNLSPSLLKDHLKININTRVSFEKNRFAGGVEGGALRFNPTQPVYDADSPFGGFFEYLSDNGDEVFNGSDLLANSPSNPVASLLQRNDVSNVRRVYGNAEFNYMLHFFPDINAVINVGFDETASTGYNELSNESRSTIDNEFVGSKRDYTSYRRNKLLDAYLSYNKALANFGVKLTAGYSYQKFESEDFNTGEQMDDGPDTEPVTNTATDVVLIGLFARTELSFFDKYLLTLSYRRDGTSRFSKTNRWGNFPAAAIGWKISDEPFLKDSKILSNLKLRLGYGITGQQDIGAPDAYLARYVLGEPSSQYIFGNTPIGIGLPQFRNENLKWEETTTYNLGIDFGFLNDGINGTFDVFYKKSEDLLSFAAISDGSNFSNAGFQNIGSFTSKGLEFSLNTNIIDTKSFNWNLNVNGTYLDTEIDELALGQDVRTGGISGGTGNSIQLHRQGFSPRSFWVYKQIYDAQGNPIEGGYADLNGDNTIDDEDRYIYRNPNADITMGLLSTINYKNLDLSFNMRGSLGNYVYNNVNSANAQFDLINANGIPANVPKSVLDTKFNTTSSVILSDIYVENASFLKLDNVTMGYTFKNFFGETASCRVWGGVQNVFVLSNYSGIDPEIFNGIDNTIYPRPRTYLLGTNIKF